MKKLLQKTHWKYFKPKRTRKMENLFSETDSKTFVERYHKHNKDLSLCVYTSRLIGKNSDLVLHGGGNTSVKTELMNITGENQDVIFVKGSGSDLFQIKHEEFAGLKLDELIKLQCLNSLDDKELDNQHKINRISAFSPDPSVETIVHAFLPHKYINHTHADSILILTHHKNCSDIVNNALGNKIAVLPYIMSGFPLAKSILDLYEKNKKIESVIIINHGIFTFADNAKKAYELMIYYVDKAENYIKKKIDKKLLSQSGHTVSSPRLNEFSIAKFVQTLRGACAFQTEENKTRRFFVEIRNSRNLLETAASSKALNICFSGVLTPDHVIRTKNKMVHIDSVPENNADLKDYLNKKIEDFKNDYIAYFNQGQKRNRIKKIMTDPVPRLFLVAGIGLVSIGFTKKDACIAADIGEHTIRAKLKADLIGEYMPVSESHIFDMEYWEFQQRKLDKSSGLLEGQIAVVTGGGGAIGFGIAKQLLGAGASVVLSDIDKQRLEKSVSLLLKTYDNTRVKSIVFDVTEHAGVEKAFNQISLMFGGIDILVPNAGIAHVATIEELEPETFEKVIRVNLNGVFNVIKCAAPVFKRQKTGGNIIVISSKNVFDPGEAFGAYSASKAGAHQISKIAAIELSKIGVRVNMINPDAVFGDESISSKLWDLIGPDRMKSRGLDAEGLKTYYQNRSLLKQPVLAEHVGNAVVFFASEQTPTTGASLPVDGGISSAFPR